MYGSGIRIPSKSFGRMPWLSETQLAAGVRHALDLTHNLAHRQSLAGRRVVCIMSGGNLDVGMLARLLTTELQS
jgi:threonine dehydratase